MTKKKKFIFKNLNVTLENNKVVGIFSESGSGKSTFVDLITGILMPESGNIEINGKNLNENLNLIKKLTSYLPQQIFLIDGTIQENIALGEDIKNINKQKLYSSMEKAELYNLVKDLPERYKYKNRRQWHKFVRWATTKNWISKIFLLWETNINF